MIQISPCIKTEEKDKAPFCAKRQHHLSVCLVWLNASGQAELAASPQSLYIDRLGRLEPPLSLYISGRQTDKITKIMKQFGTFICLQKFSLN